MLREKDITKMTDREYKKYAEIEDEIRQRLEKLGAGEMAFKFLVAENKPCVSVNGKMYDFTKEEGQKILNEARKIEKEYNGVVYHVIHSFLGDMSCWNFLWLSLEYKDEWELEKEDAENGLVMAYVYNETVKDFSEFGTINVAVSNTKDKGLVRE